MHDTLRRAASTGALDTTLELLERVRRGDHEALEALLARYLPRMRRWARGRIPLALRDLADTDDVVQDVLIRTIRRLDHLSIRGEAAFEFYVRQALRNRICDEIRAAARRVPHAPVEEGLEDTQPSPVERAVGRAELDRYERALQRISEEERHAIVGRFELGYDYRELAAALGKYTPDAARKLVQRAVARLAEAMSRDSG